jgi:hypothetical protein
VLCSYSNSSMGRMAALNKVIIFSIFLYNYIQLDNVVVKINL